MDILEVLNNLVSRDHLFSFIETNDLLRLRRVNKTFKEEAEDFIRTKKVASKRWLRFDLCGNDPFKQFNNFRNSLTDLPTRTRADVSLFSLKGRKVLMHGNLRQHFLDTYGSSITHLTLFGLTLPLCSKSKFEFFDPFPNVTHLRIEALDEESEIEISSPTTSAGAQEIKFPATLKKLKSLTVWNIAPSRSQNGKNKAFDFIAKLVETCLPTLEELDLPYEELSLEQVDMAQVMSLVCKCLFTASNLKLHVDGQCIEDLLKPDEHTPEMGTMYAVIKRMNDKIISIEQPLLSSFHLELPNMERVTFYEMDECRIPETDDFVRRNWPKLKEINVRLEDFPEGSPSPKLAVVWDFLFGNGIQREHLVRLQITFYGFRKENIEAAKGQTEKRTMNLTTSCPNLKILRLTHKIKQLVNLHNLWKGLPALEELDLWYCSQLTDFDFIGDDPQNPLFWNLKKLKILKVEQINDLQLTNDLLSKVLCQMPIKRLILSSDRLHPAQHSISLEGIQSLLAGQFASRIEHLNIRDLHLANVSKDETLNLERRFRSWQMA